MAWDRLAVVNCHCGTAEGGIEVVSFLVILCVRQLRITFAVQLHERCKRSFVGFSAFVIKPSPYILSKTSF